MPIRATGYALSATAVEAVRGVLITAHLFLREDVEEKRIWQVYRGAYGKEPFIRLVRERQGLYRLPEPKILSGSNYCDIGFALDREAGPGSGDRRPGQPDEGRGG